MTQEELERQRAENFRINGRSVRTIEDAREFIDAVGFCLMYPERGLPMLPTFIGAYAGSSTGLPDSKHAFADARALAATELMVRLLRERRAYEMDLGGGANLVVSAQMFPFVYGLKGDRTPKSLPKGRGQGGPALTELAVKVFEAVQKKGPLSKNQLRETLGRELSMAALDRALGELWARLKITRVDYRQPEGAFWDVLYRWAPDVVKEGTEISGPEATSALVSKFVETMGAVDQEEIENFLSRMTSRSKVREAVHALLAAREVSFVTIDGKTLVRMTPAPEPRRQRG